MKEQAPDIAQRSGSFHRAMMKEGGLSVLKAV